MKTTYKTLIIALTLFLLGVNWHMLFRRDIGKEMLDYMKDKYNEDFTIVGTDLEAWNDSTKIIAVEPAAFPGKYVKVRRDKDGVIFDGYLALKLNAEVEKEISRVAFEVYGENKVFNLANTTADYNYTDPNMSVENFLKLYPPCTTATIYVTKDHAQKEKDVETFRQVLKEKGYYLDCHICYVKKEGFEDINAENENQYGIGYTSEFTKEQSMIEMFGDFITNDSFEFKFYEWTDPQDCLIKKKSE